MYGRSSARIGCGVRNSLKLLIRSKAVKTECSAVDASGIPSAVRACTLDKIFL